MTKPDNIKNWEDEQEAKRNRDGVVKKQSQDEKEKINKTIADGYRILGKRK